MPKYVLKIDLDVRLDEGELGIFRHTRRLIANGLNISILSFITHDSASRGHHFFIRVESPNILTPEELNFAQFLMGDDQTRYKINKERLEKGIPWKLANVLFSRVIERRSYDKRKP